MLAYFLFLISKEDIKTRQIPDELTLLVVALSIGRGGFSLKILNLSLLVLILTGLISGLGDAKLFGALTLLFGYHIFYILFFSFILAFLYLVPLLLLRKISLKDTIAFAPFISIATIGVMLM